MSLVNLQKMSTAQIIKRMEKAPDFGYDDEAHELDRREIKWKWRSNNEIEVLK